MNEKPQITALIDEWKPRKALADDIGANLAVVHKWAAADRIPSDWQSRVLAAARRKGLNYVTAQWMLDVHSRDVRAA